MTGLDDETLAGLKERTRASWNDGDYEFIGRLLEPVAQVLVDACAVSAGQEVLDVAAGDGNVTIAAAREGASVVATDISTAQVARGRARTESEGYSVDWLEADAEELPFEDGRFDAALSAFGAIFAPRPRRVAEELFRVVRPGGTVGLTAWLPDGFSGRMIALANSFLPPTPGLEPSTEWAKEERVRERFEGLAGSITFERANVAMQVSSFEDMWERMSTAAGGLGALRRNAPPDVLEQVRQSIEGIARECSRAEGDGLAVDSAYLVIIARKPG